ncbi:MAG: bifunctional aspartate kinase/homoserine dehydrogenase I [Thermomonas sp.]|uniref:bifunctional aspartate kinase/homoserine dehydrogenase I n=1 Tax=Thermomonas sp. TaxID=1971895 RepID=UPI001ECB9598|nr:bifunctional aspartate kinase/homoserine dehydrogenase I [Thermomonas sp.]MBV2209827.1 bifunctional aspartate kinase/homoserine dehydrogenase I [Thermomonas sp.]
MNAALQQDDSDPSKRTAHCRTHKFGGSSLADAARIRHVADLLIADDAAQQIAVTSAMQGTTNALIALSETAAAGGDWKSALEHVRQRHVDTAHALLQQPEAMQARVNALCDELTELLHATALLRQPGRAALERVQGMGEVLSTTLLNAHLCERGHDYALLDARDVLVVKHTDLGAVVDWEASAKKLAEWRNQHPQPRVNVTGFVASDANGMPTTLGRNGSDYSAAIFASLFDADELHIWSDVDGVLSADPRVVPEAVPLTAMSYREACELAYFGAKVIHPQTMTPAIARGLPILMRNTFRPEFPGTRIDAEGDRASTGPVKGLTLGNHLALLCLEGTGLIGVPGTAERVFAALRAAHVSVVMISQGSSEHSICCVVHEQDAARAREALREAFANEIASEQVHGVRMGTGISVLAAVGDGMAGTPGVAAQMFDALARARVNIRAIAQGASERNISVAISSEDATRALRAVHASFWLSPQTIALAVIGPGKVGSALLDQLQTALPRLRAVHNIDLRLRALATRNKLWLHEHGNDADWHARMQTPPAEANLDHLAEHLLDTHLPHAVIIDCSGSNNVAEHYPKWLAAGIHVITPNKQAGAGPLQRYADIRSACKTSGARFRYEATVGAGLPVISTLRDLLDTGDELLSIEGIFSGTLAWLFNKFDGSKPFSALVREAHTLGYTEPDPRDDLSGTDVARKLVILARESGMPISLDDVQVQSLVPEALRGADRDAFMAGLEALDAPMQAALNAAKANGCVLRYVASLDHNGNASVTLKELPTTHAFAHLRLTDNCVSFTTRRYCDNPLVVQGPGAGPEVTAAGVFSDLLRLCAALGAKL